MKKYYIKTQDKVEGPFSVKQISSSLRADLLDAADLLSDSPEGPWESIEATWRKMGPQVHAASATQVSVSGNGGVYSHEVIDALDGPSRAEATDALGPQQGDFADAPQTTAAEHQNVAAFPAGNQSGATNSSDSQSASLNESSPASLGKSEMTFFIKRGEKIGGPYTEAKIKSGVKSKKLGHTDLISTSKDGPWKPLSTTRDEKIGGPYAVTASKPGVKNDNRKHSDSQEVPRQAPIRVETETPNSVETSVPFTQSAQSSQVPMEVDEPQSVNPLPVPSSAKQCPFCAETIKFAAIKCKHCGSMLTGATPATPSINLPEMDVSGWRDNTLSWFMKHRVIFEYIAVWLLWPAYAFFTIGLLTDEFVFQRGSQLSLLAAVVSLAAAFGVSFWCRSRVNRQHHDFLVTSVWNLMLCLLVGLMGVFLITEVIGIRTYDEELIALTVLMAGPFGASLSGKLGTRVRSAILMFYGVKGPFKKRHLIHAIGTLVACCTFIYVGQGVKRSMDYDRCVQTVREHLEEYLELRKSIVKLDVDVRDVSRFSDEMNRATSVGGFGATQRLNAVTSAMERDRQRVQSGKERLKTQIEQALHLNTKLASHTKFFLPESRRNDLVPGYDFTWTRLKQTLDDDRNEFMSMK